MATALLPRLTVAEYFDLELTSSTRHEYLDGAIIAMAGGTYNHSLVTNNVSGALSARLPDCAVTGPDMKVQIESDRWFAYPDVVVTCDKPRFLEPAKVTLLNPVFVVEVLSPTTRAFDCGIKAQGYRGMPSIEGFLLIEPDRVCVEYWRRAGDGWHSNLCTDSSAVLQLEVPGCQVPIAAFYRGVNTA